MTHTTRQRYSRIARYLAALLIPLMMVAIFLGMLPATTQATIAAAEQYPVTDVDVPSPATGPTEEIQEDAVKETEPESAAALLQAVVVPATAAPAVADTAPPQVSGLFPVNGSFTGPLPTMRYEFTDPSGVFWPDGVHLYIDNRCSRTMPGATDITASSLTYAPGAPLAEGQHNLKAFLCDNLFNCGTTNWSITVDASPPRFTETSPTGSLSSGDVTIRAAYNDGAGSGVNVTAVNVILDGTDITGACAVTAGGVDCTANGLGDGSHSVTITVPDVVGQSAASSWDFSVEAGSVGITGQTPAPNSWSRSSQPLIAAAFQPAATGTVDASSLAVFLNGTDVTSQATVGNGGFSLTPAGDLLDGIQTVRVQVADNAGHAGASQWSFSTDTEAPEITGSTPVGTAVASSTVTAVFNDAVSGVDPATVRLILDGEEVTTAATYDAAGISYVHHHPLSAGNHSVQLDVSDFAGNHRGASWSFSVPGAAAGGQPGGNHDALAVPAAPAAAGYSFITTLFSPGRWALNGVTAYPHSYYFPWYETLPMPGFTSRLVIANEGAGEAFASIFVSGKEIWRGKIAEGGEVAVPPVGNGPVKVVCPTGQPLATTLELAGEGWDVSLRGVNGDNLSTSWLLPWYEGDRSGVRNSLAITNAGGEPAEVDVYIGDSLLAESLRGHYTIAPDTAVMADFPGVSGGMVKIVSTNGQPLLTGIVSRSGDSLSLTAAACLRQLDDSYSIERGSLPEADELWLMVGNPNGAAVELNISGDEDGGDDDESSFKLAPEESRLVELDPATDGTIDIACDGCGFGRGIIVGWRAAHNGRLEEAIIVPEIPTLWR